MQSYGGPSTIPPYGARPSYIPHPREYDAREHPPTRAFLLTLLGGIFFLLEGVLATYITLAVLGITPGGFGTGYFSGAVITAAIGVLLIVVAFFVYYSPAHHRADGAIIVLLAIVGLLTSSLGGLYLGWVFAMAGGASAYAWTPPSVGGAEAVRRAKTAGQRTSP